MIIKLDFLLKTTHELKVKNPGKYQAYSTFPSVREMPHFGAEILGCRINAKKTKRHQRNLKTTTHRTKTNKRDYEKTKHKI